jgi:hypothetical protein
MDTSPLGPEGGPPNTDAYTYTDAYTDAYTYTDAYAYTYTDAYAYAYTYTEDVRRSDQGRKRKGLPAVK